MFTTTLNELVQAVTEKKLYISFKENWSLQPV